MTKRGPRRGYRKRGNKEEVPDVPVKPEPRVEPTWQQREEQKRKDDAWWRARGVAMRETGR